jgi:tRNA threonylcarbamoyladenosine biosynthesis protein TsaB
MIVLAIDTCLAACQAALVDGSRTVAAMREPMMRGHQERLAPMVRDLMAQAKAPFGVLDRIGVTVGPGSFTGLRVGLAFAKGLGLALGRPCIGVGTLQALALDAEPRGPCAALIDAGRGRVFVQMFDAGEPLTGPDILGIDEALARLVEVFPLGEFTLAGPGAPLVGAAWPTARQAAAEAPDPAVVARLAAIGPPTPATPLYLRPADAIPRKGLAPAC